MDVFIHMPSALAFPIGSPLLRVTLPVRARSDAVVDPDSMRVHGTEGLRVVDASMFPHVSNGSIYAPTMMAAEKAADLIRGLTPLAASEAPFYRYGASAASPSSASSSQPAR